MTQERLAEALCISPQAVSRWETDAAMPDISLLPAICHLFDVSADTLLGINGERKEQQIREISQNSYSFSSRGYYEDARRILEDGLRQFPNAEQLTCDLMYISYWQATRREEVTGDEKDDFRRQAIALGERLLESCTKDHIRHSAIQILCFAYRDIGEEEKARELARSMPNMSVSQEMLLPDLLDGTDGYQAQHNLVFNLVQFLGNQLGGAMNYKLDTGEWAYTNEEIAVLREKRIAFYELFFEDGDFGFYHTKLSDCHTAQAKHYAGLGDRERVLSHLTRAAEHAIKFTVEFNENATHTSLAFRGQTYGVFSTSNRDNDALQLLKEMEKPRYDFVREEKVFLSIKERLEKHAGFWNVKQ